MKIHSNNPKYKTNEQRKGKSFIFATIFYLSLINKGVLRTLQINKTKEIIRVIFSDFLMILITVNRENEVFIW